MSAIDLSFRVNSPLLFPVDHGYPLCGAVSRLIPEAHGGNGFAVAPIPGRQVGGRQMKLDKRSRLVIRTSPEKIAQFLPLAGRTLDLCGGRLALGVPSVYPLMPCSSVRARMVTIKGFLDSESFRDAVRRQLDSLEIGDCQIEVGRRRTLRIKQREIVGFGTTIHQLTGEDSLTVAVHGIGGRRHMGCGFFVACKWDENNGQS